jgi:hypothetical protein
MEEETKSKDFKTIKLTAEEYRQLEKSMQWPEDLAAWEKTDKPTNLSELAI